jgi:hypothetical protein
MTGPEVAAPRPTRSLGQALLVGGSVVGLVGLVTAVSTAWLGSQAILLPIIQPLDETLSGPAYDTPMDETLDLDAGQYEVFEFVGTSESDDPDLTEFPTTTVTGDDVGVSSPAGDAVAVEPVDPGQVTWIDENDVYVGVARFSVDEAGEYQVRVDGDGAAVRVGRSLPDIVVSGFAEGARPAIYWTLAALAPAFLVLPAITMAIAGIVLLSSAGRVPAGPPRAG